LTAATKTSMELL